VQTNPPTTGGTIADGVKRRNVKRLGRKDEEASFEESFKKKRTRLAKERRKKKK